MNPKEQLAKLMGDSLARGFDREMKYKIQLLFLELKLIDLELDILLLGRQKC